MTQKFYIFGDSQADMRATRWGRIGKVLKEYLVSKGWESIFGEMKSEKNGKAGATIGRWTKSGAQKNNLVSALGQSPKLLFLIIGGNDQNVDEGDTKKAVKDLVRLVFDKAPDSTLVWVGPPIIVGRGKPLGFSLDRQGPNSWSTSEGEIRFILNKRIHDALEEMMATGNERMYNGTAYMPLEAGTPLLDKKVVFINGVTQWEDLYPELGRLTGDGLERPYIPQIDEDGKPSYAGTLTIKSSTNKYDGVHIDEAHAREAVNNLMTKWKSKFWPDDPYN